MDNIEKYIREHKDHFDHRKAPDGLWQSIEKEINQPPANKKSWNNIIALLALCLMFSLAILKINQKADTSNDQNLDPEMYTELNEYQESEYFFKNLSKEYINELATLGAESAIFDDLKIMNEYESELKKELLTAHGQHKLSIIEALMQNHLTQISLLQELIEELKNSKKNESIYQQY